MRKLTAQLMRRFRPLIVWWIRITGLIFKSDAFYYITTVQKRIFDRHKLTTNAAAISFFFLLSIVPMLFILIAIIGSMLDSPEEAENTIIRLMGDRAPEHTKELLIKMISESKLIANVKSLMANKGWVGIASVASLLWTSSGAFAAIEDAMTTIFGVKGRNYFVSRLVEMSMVLVTGSLFLLSNMVNVILQTIRQQGKEMLGMDISGVTFLWHWATSILPYVITIGLFYLMYKILPKTKIYKRAALLGATVAGVLLEGTIFGFSYYVKNFSRYDAFYGSVAGIVITFFCVYLASIILLIGAEVTEIANTRIENRREMELTLRELT